MKDKVLIITQLGLKESWGEDKGSWSMGLILVFPLSYKDFGVYDREFNDVNRIFNTECWREINMIKKNRQIKGLKPYAKELSQEND